MTLRGISSILLLLNSLLIGGPELIVKLQVGIGPLTLNRILSLVSIWFAVLLLVKKEGKEGKK